MKVMEMQFPKTLAGIIMFTLFIFFAAALYGCSDNPAAPQDENNNPPNPGTGTGNTIPAALVGDWYAGDISSVNFYNPSNGSWGAPSGTGMFYKFKQNGTYEKGVLLQSSLYGCTMSFLAYNSGTMTVEGDKIVLTPTYGQIKSVDNCVAANNYEKPDELVTEIIFFEFAPDDFGNTPLWMRYETSSASAFYQR